MLLNTIIYTGKEAPAASKDPASRVVLRLIKPYTNSGYRLYVDNWYTVPLKSKLTVPRASRLDTRSSIVSSIESRVSRIESRVSSIKLRVKKVNELVAWLISREINCTNGLPVLRTIVPLSLAITKMSAIDSIANTDKGTRVFSCDVYANEWVKIK